MSRILIVDDIVENRYLLDVLFKGAGHETLSAGNGAEALDSALQSLPDLIVSDILMPVMDGFELCRQLKSDSRLKRIPFIFFTATYTDMKDERFALSLGADRFVTKPQAPEALMRVVDEVLEQAHRGLAGVTEAPSADDAEMLRQYNETLFRKLEKKVMELEAEAAERRRVEAALRDNQARLVEAHRLAHIGIWSWDAAHDLVTWSEELYRIAGLDPSQPAPRYAEQSRIYSKESWARLNASVTEALQDGKSYQLDLEFVRPDGTRRWAYAFGGPKYDSGGQVTGLHGTVQDITEKLSLTLQLYQSQKMESIGLLAGGIAHDFNNMLSVILNCADFAMGSVDKDSSARRDLAQIIKAGERAANLTRQLLTFSRRQLVQRVSLNLNQMVVGIEKMLERIIGENIEFIQHLAPDLGPVSADPGQIEQVIMNLVVNARDAMPSGGKIILETAEVEIDETYAANHLSLEPGPYVMLAVSDTGCGMDDNTKQRLFDPFFTTKEKGKGTGLGLSTVYGIVKQSGGGISVYSELEMGAVFRIYLPKELGEIRESKVLPAIPTQPTGDETILVVEDEEALRDVIRRSLQAAGYTVLTAADGEAAIQRSAEYEGDIQLLLTDIVMPKMSGRTLVEKLRLLRPSTAVLYMSGYTDDTVIRRGVVDEGVHFIGKPFTAGDLTLKVRQVLDENLQVLETPPRP